MYNCFGFFLYPQNKNEIKKSCLIIQKNMRDNLKGAW